MPRVPFSFTLTGGADVYGALFENADDVPVATAQGNDVLVGILAASSTPVTYGITLPPTARAYKITKIVVKSEDSDDDVSLVIFNSTTAVGPMGMLTDGSGTLEAPINVPSGHKPALLQNAAANAGRVAGYVDWEAA